MLAERAGPAARSRWVGVVLRDLYWPCREGDKYANADRGRHGCARGGENYRADVQEHFDRGAAPEAHRFAHVHLRGHLRTAVRRAAPVEAGIGQEGGDRSLDRRYCPGASSSKAGWKSCGASVCPGVGGGRVIVAPAQP